MRTFHPAPAVAAVLACCAFVPAAVSANEFYTIETGRYLVRAGDCEACHTADNGKPFAGGRPIPTPFGTIYSTNITPDPDTGIGKWSDEDFYKAMHSGVGPDGEHFYPAFPYPWFTKASRADIMAIRGYLQTLAPVRQDNKPNKLPWPLSWRGGMPVWNGMYFDEGQYRPDPKQSAQWNRGAYLVQGLGHCGACHTPKNVLGGSKKDDRFEGGYGEHWYAPDLTSSKRDGLGNWSVEDIVAYLRTGSASHTAAAGPMGEVVQHSTQYLNEEDLRAIAVYLKSLPAEQETAGHQDVDKQVMARGQGVYLDQCAGCHMENGEGLPNVFPALKGSSAIQAEKPATLLHVVLGGASKVSTPLKPTPLAMPAFDGKLTDDDIAAVLTYIRNAWGNSAPPVGKDDVAKVRDQMNAVGAAAVR
jgi:mono/diheme cytochrome c family protein